MTEQDKEKIFEAMRICDELGTENLLQIDKEKRHFILKLSAKNLLIMKRFFQFGDVDRKVFDECKNRGYSEKEIILFSSQIFSEIYKYTAGK